MEKNKIKKFLRSVLIIMALISLTCVTSIFVYSLERKYIIINDLNHNFNIFKTESISELNLFDPSYLTLKDLHKCYKLEDLVIVESREEIKSNLDFLNELSLSNLKIIGVWKDFSGISRLKSVKNIEIDHCSYFNNSDLQYFYNLDSLEKISLHHTKVTDISNVEMINNLKFLDISYNTEINTLDNIDKCNSLIELDIRNLQINDYSPLLSCRNLETLYVSKQQLSEQFMSYLYDNGINVVLEN